MSYQHKELWKKLSAKGVVEGVSYQHKDLLTLYPQHFQQSQYFQHSDESQHYEYLQQLFWCEL